MTKPPPHVRMRVFRHEVWDPEFNEFDDDDAKVGVQWLGEDGTPKTWYNGERLGQVFPGGDSVSPDGVSNFVCCGINRQHWGLWNLLPGSDRGIYDECRLIDAELYVHDEEG